MKLPSGAREHALKALNEAEAVGHDFESPRWHQITRRVYGAVCRRCEGLVLVSDLPGLGWKTGGSATRGWCPRHGVQESRGNEPYDHEPFGGDAA